jgi:hypothetical protein
MTKQVWRWCSALAWLAACGAGPDGASSARKDAANTDAALAQEVQDADTADTAAASFVVVNWNVGTVGGVGSDPAAVGFGKQQKAWSDEHYGNGLAFLPAVAEAKTWLATHPADIVAFQEIFDPALCAEIPLEAHVGFVCEGWQTGMPTVAEQLVGAGFVVACHPGKSDKCIAVRQTFASIDGCSGPLCRDAGFGYPISGCGKGARAARFVLRRPGGEVLHVRHVHGNSGLADSDKQCRVQLFQAALTDLEPGRHLVLGDFNTDPVRFAGLDPSADALLALTASGQPLQFLTEIGADTPPTYGGLVGIDHVLGVGLQGSCSHAGVSADLPAASTVGWWDHTPVRCLLQ